MKEFNTKLEYSNDLHELVSNKGFEKYALPLLSIKQKESPKIRKKRKIDEEKKLLRNSIQEQIHKEIDSMFYKVKLHRNISHNINKSILAIVNKSKQQSADNAHHKQKEAMFRLKQKSFMEKQQIEDSQREYEEAFGKPITHRDKQAILMPHSHSRFTLKKIVYRNKLPKSLRELHGLEKQISIISNIVN